MKYKEVRIKDGDNLRDILNKIPWNIDYDEIVVNASYGSHYEEADEYYFVWSEDD